MTVALVPCTMIPNPTEPCEDAMLTENLRLVRPLAEGGMGSVWLARHLRLDIPVAVKFMSDASYWSTAVAEERFVREARAAACIRHPNVVRILDFGHAPWTARTPYIVMEYLEGIDLERHIAQRGRLDLEEVLGIVSAVASVLERAHELGIVHRDIKPGNVLLEGALDRPAAAGPHFHTVKVFDFGVALFRNDATSRRMTLAGELVGTPFFMSPEQFVNPREVDRQCDLWALAVLAYEALLGNVPFHGETPTGVYLAASQGRYTAPTRLRPELSPAMDRFFRTAFAQDPARRFPSAAAMAHAFANAAEPPQAKSPPLRARRELPHMAISAAFVLMVMIGAAAAGRTNVDAKAQARTQAIPNEHRPVPAAAMLSSADSPLIEFPDEPRPALLQPASDIHTAQGHAKPAMRRHAKQPKTVGAGSFYYLY